MWFGSVWHAHPKWAPGLLLLGVLLGVLLGHSGAVAGCDSGDVSGHIAWIVAGSDAWPFRLNFGMGQCDVPNHSHLNSISVVCHHWWWEFHTPT